MMALIFYFEEKFKRVIMKKIFTIVFILASFLSYSQSTTVVISQVYGGGGGSTGTYLFDYVELHNISGTTQSLNGTSIQYGSATGNFGSAVTNVYAFPAGTTIPAGGYLLIQCGPTGTAGAAFPVTPDLITSNLTMSGASGKVVLANQATALGCGATATACTLPNASIIDLVAYGTSNNAEGGVSVNNGVALTSVQGAVRKTNGCTETDNNNADFTVVTAPVPHNSGSAAAPCGAVSPSLSGTALSSFGNVCTGTTTAPNSFTITGTSLTNANITVGPLTGFTFSTTSGGTYSASLNLTQPGGSYSQAIFVEFNPALVQSYNGNIPVGGGGATTINIAAVGSGVNSQATVVTGSSSAITTSTATLAGSISASGCSTVTAYGIEYSTVNGFANGSGTPVLSSNLTAGNFSSDLAGLTPGVTYYYHAYTTNSGGTAYGAQQSFTTVSLSPVLTVTPLTAFGAVCQNATAGPNTFTVSGTNLTSANITVGPLAGFTFSTTSGGVYTASLTLIQPGGNYSQQIFVKFSPVAVQSYSGNIPVSGGGATATSVSASGSGVNTAATVTTGAATAVTTTSATLAGSIPTTGCSPISAYGVEYSTTNGFPNGGGTQSPSSNLAGGVYNSSVSGLLPSTTYYYKAYATNAGGTTYGVQQSFTTANPVITATPLTAFGSVCINTTTSANSFTISSTGLSNANVVVGPIAGFAFSTTANGTYTPSLTLVQPGGPYNQAVFVKFTPTAVQSYSGNIPVSGGGSTPISVAVTGSGSNTAASVTTGPATVTSPNAATLSGSVTGIGCSPVTSYGIMYSGINGFTSVNGTKVEGANLSGTDFSVNINGLVQATVYYYKAYVTNSGGTTYGTQLSFTTDSIPGGLIIYSSPVTRGGLVHYSLNNVKPGHYQVQIFNSVGQMVYHTDIILQVNFIDNYFVIPAYIGRGLYTLQIHNQDVKIHKLFMVN